MKEATITDSKNVDFLLSLDPLKGTALRAVIDSITYSECIDDPAMELPHINQTLYPLLRFALTGVTIETRAFVGGKNLMPQFGIWLGTWHERMSCQ